LGQGVLKMLGSIHSVSIREADIDELRERMLTMPAHSDVPTGLEQLKDAGFRLITLTNSPPDPQLSPLKHAGIDGWFERSFSVDRVRRFKPAPQVYHMVAEELDVPAVREPLSPVPAMRLSRFTGCLSRRWWRRISQAFAAQMIRLWR
jgi:2-haloacid dehalogenase